MDKQVWTTPKIETYADPVTVWLKKGDAFWTCNGLYNRNGIKYGCQDCEMRGELHPFPVRLVCGLVWGSKDGRGDS